VSFAALLLFAATSAEPPPRLEVRVAPPIARFTTTLPHRANDVGLGGLALGVTTSSHLWAEVSADALVGLAGAGLGANAYIGYAFADAPTPHEWSVRFPAFVGYRHLRRPSSHSTDGYTAYETLDLAAVGARVLFNRTFVTDAFELGIGASAGIPLSRSSVGGVHYADGETKVFLDLGVTLGWSFGL
jgi:hypothetical protein